MQNIIVLCTNVTSEIDFDACKTKKNCCLGFQQALVLHRIEHRGLPAARVLHQRNRHLDHVLGLQLLGRDMEEHVGALGNRRGRQLEDERRVQALQRFSASKLRSVLVLCASSTMT